MASKAFRSIETAALLFLAMGKLDLVVAQVSGGPSSNCHVTDGSFTGCPNGRTEWADVTPVAFPASNSYLYVNQDASHSSALNVGRDVPPEAIFEVVAKLIL